MTKHKFITDSKYGWFVRATSYGTGNHVDMSISLDAMRNVYLEDNKELKAFLKFLDKLRAHIEEHVE